MVKQILYRLNTSLFYIFWRSFIFIEFNSLTTQSIKNSCPELFCKKVICKNFAKFTGKHQCRSLFLWFQTWIFIVTKLQCRCFQQILQNFQVHLSLHMTQCDCFCLNSYGQFSLVWPILIVLKMNFRNIQTRTLKISCRKMFLILVPLFFAVSKCYLISIMMGNPA